MASLVNVKNPLISQKSLFSRFTALFAPSATFKIVYTNSLIWSILSCFGIELIQWFHKYRVNTISESLIFFTNLNSVSISASMVRWFQRFLFILRLVSLKFFSLFDFTSLGSFQISPGSPGYRKIFLVLKYLNINAWINVIITHFMGLH